MKGYRKHSVVLLVMAMLATACVSEADPTTTSAAAAAPTTEAPATTTADTAPATSAAPGTGAPAVESVTIGSIHPLTGALAGAGIRMDNGAKMAAEEINAAGGISSLGGATLEVLSADSTGAPEVGQSEAVRLIGEGVSALIGAYQSAVTTTIAAVAERDGVALVIDVAVADSILDQGYTHVFRLQPNATAMGQYGVQFLAEVAEAAGEEVTTVAYLHEDSGFGASVADAFEAAGAEYGIEVAARIPYPAFEVTDLTTEMTQAAAVDPDVVIDTGYYPDGLLAARAAVDLNLDIQGFYGVAQGAYHLPQFTTDFGEDSEFFLNSNYHFDTSDPAVVEVTARFEEAYGEPMDTEAMLAYQAIYVVADALERAGSADPAAVRDALAETNLADHMMAYPGPIAFDETGETISAQPVLMQVLDNTVTQVWPEALQEAEPVYPATSWGQ